MQKKFETSKINTKTLDLRCGLELYIDCYLQNKDGSDKRKVLSKKADSFTKNFAYFLYQAMSRDCREPEPISYNNTKRGWWRDSNVFLTVRDQGSGTSVDPSHIRLGGLAVGTSNQQVSWDDLDLVQPIANGSGAGQLAYQSDGDVAPSVGIETSTWAYFRSFGNNSGADIDVGEVGLFHYNAGNLYHNPIPSTNTVGSSTADSTYLLARDVFSPKITVPNGTVFTVEYRFTTQFSPATGGWLRQFNDILYRQMANRSFSAFDLTGVSRSSGRSSQNLIAGGVGGAGLIRAFESDAHHTNHANPDFGMLGYQHGVIIGTDDNELAIDNTDMESRIAHGTGAGEMLHYGTTCHNFRETPAQLRGEWDIERMFLNKSGADITVREAGFTLLGDAVYPHLCVRDKIDPGVVVGNNEGLMVRYTFYIADEE